MSIMTYWPVITMGISLTMAGGGGYINLRLQDNTLLSETQRIDGRVSTVRDTLLDKIQLANNELADNSESIDTNEEAIEEIQRILIERQGQTDLKVQQIQNEVSNTNMKLDQLLLILKDLRNSQ